MSEAELIVIGGGPAGLAAAAEAARNGIAVEIVEQRATPGGAVHRQPVGDAVAVAQPAAAHRRFARLVAGIATPLVSMRTSTTFLGLDGEGLVLLENRESRKAVRLRAKAVILATGAVEKVRPVPGWELAGVSTAGGLQVMMKETGRPPAGRVLLAGSGPLLVAVAAQMAKAGNPPVAIVESGDPLAHPLAGLGLLGHPALLAEAAGYMARVLAGGVPWRRGARLVRIERAGEALAATLLHRNGRQERLLVDRIGLHDGLRENDIALPDVDITGAARPFILRAGDCRRALGAPAAVADGRRAGAEAARLIAGRTGSVERMRREIARQERAQALLARLFAPVKPLPPLASLPDETVICRCEGRSVGDMKALLAGADGLSGREIKHNGRFAMGACQGRFCAANAAALMAELRPDMPPPAVRDLTGRRWPVRPVSIAALVSAASQEIEKE